MTMQSGGWFYKAAIKDELRCGYGVAYSLWINGMTCGEWDWLSTVLTALLYLLLIRII